MSLAWTHTMGYQDVRSLLRHARIGDAVAVWQAEAVKESRLLAGSRKDTQLRIATTILRPREHRIIDDGFLADLAVADETTARDLIYARYLASVPIAVAVAERYFRIGEPGAPEEIISRYSIDAFLRDALPGCAEGTRSRTRTAIGTQFSAAGVTRVERDGKLERTGRRPAPIAVLHILSDDLQQRREASDAWLAQHSIAAAIFAIDQATFADILEHLIGAGRLRRSYYAGEPRVLAA